MSLPPIICANCGRAYDLPEHLSHGPCIGCQTINCRPQAEGESLDRLQRATRLRLEGNHGEALKCYEHVLVDYDDEHTALWGKLLCQYGVEFVTDPKTGVRHATVHVPQSRPMQLHADFSRACELAPEEVRAQYEADASYVDEALAEINRHKESSPPYDVFICHKTTHLTGPGYTEDYNRGVQLTMLLTGQGYRVFFAPLSGLTPGDSYEAGIYYALWSAKVMLLISSDVAFLTSPWVKSEWTRYLEMLDDGAGKHLVPLMYDRLPDSRMPREIRLRRLQSIRMDSDLDAKDKLLAALAKFTGKGTPAPVQPVQPVEAPAPQPAPKAEPEKEQPAPVVKEAPAKPQVAPVVKAEPVKPQAAPVVKAEPVKPRPAVPAGAPAIHFDAVPVNGGVSITKYTGPGGEVVIPATIGGKPVVEIGVQAFRNCAHLKKVTVPESVKCIGNFAFSRCTGLTEVVLPEGVETVGNQAFLGCSGLASVVIPASVEKIGEMAFSGCSALTCVNLPKGVTTIEKGTFYECSRLLKVDVPATLRHIKASAFYGCTSLTTMKLPKGLMSIEEHAFDACPNLVLQVPENTPTHRNVQAGRLRFELISPVSRPQPAVPVSAPESHFTTDVATGGVSIAKYTGPGEEVVIPATIGGKPVVEIGKEAFKECKTLKKVEIPEGVKRLYESAFYACPALHTVRLPDSLERIDDSAFWNCKELTDVRIPDCVKQVGNCVFRGCSKMTEIHIPAGVARIGFGLLAECSSLRKITVADNNGSFYAQDGVLLSRRGELVAYPCGREASEYTIPDGVNSIGHWSFYGARKLQRVNIPQSVKILGNNGFEHCSSLVSVRIPDGVKEIPGALFDGCSSLREVYIPETVTRIGSFAFDGCSQLTSLTLPAGVSDFDKYAIERCPDLTLRVYENSEAHKYAQEKGLQFEVIGKTAASEPEAEVPRRPRRPAISDIGAADSCYQVAPVTGGVSITKYTGPGGEVTIPAAIGGKPVVEIGNGAFKACTTLTVAVIPEGVTHIGKDAFHGCSSLRSVAIPKGVTDIGPSAFYGCRSLTIAELPDSVQSIGLGAFDRCSSLISMRIPEKVMTIGDFAFCSCTSLRSVSIPESVKSIGYGAFAECRSLQDLVLPRRLPVIGENAFKNCPLSLGVRMKLKFAPQPK